MSVFRPPFHTSLAKTFVDDIYYQRKNNYYFLGRVEPWDNEGIPSPDPDNAYINDVQIRDNIVYLKKITSTDVSVVCPKHEWREGEVYDQWDNHKDMVGKPFYVLTSDYNVFKCLNNNNGAKSMFEPKETNFDITKTADGYIWKYMYNIPIVKRRKFISTNYIPVQKALTDSFYSVGALEEVVVVNGGSGYSANHQTQAVVDAPTTAGGVRAKISLFVNPTTGSIDAVSIDNAGSGYTSAPIINVVDVSGKGTSKYTVGGTAKLQANILDGKLDSVVIVDCGINYPSDISTTLSVSGDGEGCVLYPKVMNGEIVGVIVANAGSGYSFMDISAVSVSGTGSGADFEAVIGGSELSSDQASVEQLAIRGAIYSVVITEGGEGYGSNTEVVISGDGEGATAKAIVENGAIVGIEMVTYGEGYTYSVVEFKDPDRLEPNTYIDATGYCILPPTDGHGTDAVNELYGDTFSIYVMVRDDNILANLNQDYRQFGVISEPKDVRTRKKIDDTDVVVSFKITLLSTADLEVDSIIYIDNIKHRIIGINGNQIQVQQQSSIYYAITNFSSIIQYNDITGAIKYYEIVNVDETPTVDKYSGELWYSSNNTPFILMSGRTFGIQSLITL